MSAETHDRDASASQVMFLNFENPCNNPNLCMIRQITVDSLLNMLGLTPAFISSLKLPQKKAIVFLASYAIDWRTCTREYNDITFCFGRLPKIEKARLSGLEEMGGEPLDHAQHIWLDRIKPRIAQLHQRSYRLNRGISALAPAGVAVPKQVSSAPATANSPTPSAATTTTVTNSDTNGAVTSGLASNSPHGIQIANNGTTNVTDNPSNSASGSAPGSPADDTNSGEGIENDVEHNIDMQVDDDDDSLSTETDKNEVQYKDATSMTEDDNQGPPGKKRKLVTYRD